MRTRKAGFWRSGTIRETLLGIRRLQGVPRAPPPIRGAPRGIAGGRFPFPGVHRLAHRSCPSSKGARPSAQGRARLLRVRRRSSCTPNTSGSASVPTFSNARARACSRCCWRPSARREATRCGIPRRLTARFPWVPRPTLLSRPC